MCSYMTPTYWCVRVYMHKYGDVACVSVFGPTSSLPQMNTQCHTFTPASGCFFNYWVLSYYINTTKQKTRKTRTQASTAQCTRYTEAESEDASQPWPTESGLFFFFSLGKIKWNMSHIINTCQGYINIEGVKVHFLFLGLEAQSTIQFSIWLFNLWQSLCQLVNNIYVAAMNVDVLGLQDFTHAQCSQVMCCS